MNFFLLDTGDLANKRQKRAPRALKKDMKTASDGQYHQLYHFFSHPVKQKTIGQATSVIPASFL
jgi:hypothetical protein